MKNNNKEKQKYNDISSIHLRANTGEVMVIPCKLNDIQKKKPKIVT